jgi:RimJ/RimL family protein N-acetyltransferase
LDTAIAVKRATEGSIERLETERLQLRPLASSDVVALYELDSDPEVMRYTLHGRPSTLDEVEAMVRARIGARWMGYERATGEFVGWYALIPHEPGEYEIGYRLRRAMWGRGLATEGTRALVGAAFERLGATRIWGQTMAVNTRSRAVMERCGLTHVRTFHLDWDDPIPGSEEGEVEYELRRVT